MNTATARVSREKNCAGLTKLLYLRLYDFLKGWEVSIMYKEGKYFFCGVEGEYHTSRPRAGYSVEALKLRNTGLTAIQVIFH